MFSSSHVLLPVTLMTKKILYYVYTHKCHISSIIPTHMDILVTACIVCGACAALNRTADFHFHLLGFVVVGFNCQLGTLYVTWEESQQEVF